MICYGHNHYFCVFRKINHKIGYLKGIDFSRVETQARQIEREETKYANEWVLYNDDQLS